MWAIRTHNPPWSIERNVGTWHVVESTWSWSATSRTQRPIAMKGRVILVRSVVVDVVVSVLLDHKDLLDGIGECVETLADISITATTS